jgi:hypothetical protein
MNLDIQVVLAVESLLFSPALTNFNALVHSSKLQNITFSFNYHVVICRKTYWLTEEINIRTFAAFLSKYARNDVLLLEFWMFHSEFPAKKAEMEYLLGKILKYRIAVFSLHFFQLQNRIHFFTVLIFSFYFSICIPVRKFYILPRSASNKSIT